MCIHASFGQIRREILMVKETGTFHINRLEVLAFSGELSFTSTAMISKNGSLAKVATMSEPANVHVHLRKRVYGAYLRSVFDNRGWSDENFKAAENEFLGACVIDKGSEGFILVIGPILALLGGVITTLTMFKRFHGPPWPDLGTNLLLIAVILLLVGFWAMSIAATNEIANGYAFCGDAGQPLVNQGKWYDNTPCIDRDSQNDKKWNPFVSHLLWIDSCYVGGGVLTFIATLMYLGLISGFTETMMSERFGKYLVTLQDIPMKIRLPFPPAGGSRP
mmetsp:Transcript_42883/g.67260  ORF Transcript_42883/g.67260 Transcript_42883/m.67260 type:complete len:277 (+) Transcript_42883:492-1322(+)